MSRSYSDCLTEYLGHGIRFEYPDVWDLTEERDGDDVILTVSADDSCFWVLRILGSGQRPAEVLASCVSAFEDEYDDVEVENSEGVLAGEPAVNRELEFSCHELLNTAFLSCVRVERRTLLVWWQVTDHELEEIRPHFERITGSVRMADRGD